MNKRDRHSRTELGPCPKCGLYSGQRMVTEFEPARWYVICDYCGYRVGPYRSQNNATSRWNHGKEN